MQKPLSLKPLNNHLLVEVIRDDEDVIRYTQDETLRKGKVLNASFSNYHLTGMGGMRICETPQELEQMTLELDYLVGKTVMWSEGAESGTVFQHEGKDYALVSFWQLIGFEDDGSEPPAKVDTGSNVVEADLTNKKPAKEATDE